MNSTTGTAAFNGETVRTIASLWPKKDKRHCAYLALAGGLLRAGWTVERVEALIDALAEANEDQTRRSASP